MKFITKTLIVAASILVSSTVHAAVVRCTNAKVKNGPVIVEFGYSNTKSARFQGPITIEGTSILDFQVAQYKLTGSDLFVLVDDIDTSSNTIYSMTAVRSGSSSYLGVLKATDSLGNTSSKAVKCAVSAN